MTALARFPLSSRHLRQVGAVLPGLALTLAIALGALFLHERLGVGALSPLLLSIVTGIVIGNLVPLPGVLLPGIAFSMKRLLRLGVILLGLQLTLAQVAELGVSGIAIVVVTLVATFVVTRRVGAWLGVSRPLSELIAAGTAVCGASAVLATDLVSRARDEEVAYAIACVTIFGTLSMLLYPLLAVPLDLGQVAYGLWSGATIHEVAQVVAAAFQVGDEAGHTGTIAKLARVVLLAPLVFSLAFMRRGDGAGASAGRPPLPWFVLGFLAMVGLNSAVELPRGLLDDARLATTLLLSLALAAMGLETRLARLRAEGLRPLALGGFAWLFVSGLGLALVLALTTP
uniref:YeiH family protein n=1 Tax=Stappia sp. TaxID=1870903 RepID=UPI003BAD1CD8